MPVREITEECFDEIVLKSERPALLEFGAEYCAPCRVLAPVIKRISDEREDILFGVVDVEASPSIAARFGVMSVPTVIALIAGREAGRASGNITRERVIDLIGLHR